MDERSSGFFESRRRHAVMVRGRRVVGTVVWNRATGSAFVADAKFGLLKIDEDEARRVWNLEYTGGRPRIFDEPVQRVLVTLPRRLLELSCPQKDYSRQLAKILEERANKKV